MRKLTHEEISRKGGLKTLKKYGKKFYSKNGSKGGESILKSRGKAYFKKLAMASVKARKVARKIK